MSRDAAIQTLIRARVQARRERERPQIQLIKDDDLFHDTIRSKLKGKWDAPQFDNFSRCGQEEIFRTCKNCSKLERMKYRCNIKWCPRCQWRIAESRRKIIRAWAERITQPKHLVLTQRNFPILTRRRIREHTLAFAKLRRAKCLAQVRGGCRSVEITNEQRGWHLHSHVLLDVRWLDMEVVSRRWGALIGQEFGIVKIKDCRNSDYLKEICKYVVEGSELAKWPAEHVNEFCQAVRGLRFFTAFGSLAECAPEIRQRLRDEKPPPPMCECGCDQFHYEDETHAVLNEVRCLGKRVA